jgi:hypothetical protein
MIEFPHNAGVGCGRPGFPSRRGLFRRTGCKSNPHARSSSTRATNRQASATHIPTDRHADVQAVEKSFSNCEMGSSGNADSCRWATEGAHHRQSRRRFSSPNDSVSGIRLKPRDSCAARGEPQDPMSRWILGESGRCRAVSADQVLVATSAKHSARNSPLVCDFRCARGSGARSVRASGSIRISRRLRVCSG